MTARHCKGLLLVLGLLLLILGSACVPQSTAPTQRPATPVPTPRSQTVELIAGAQPEFVLARRVTSVEGFPPEICIDINLEPIHQPGTRADQLVRHYIYESQQHVSFSIGNLVVPARQILPQSSFSQREIVSTSGEVIDLAYCIILPNLPDGLYEATLSLATVSGEEAVYNFNFRLKS